MKLTNEAKRYWKDQDIYLRNSGWVRTWPSTDIKGCICISVHENVFCNRMTRAETKRLIARLQYLLARKS